MNLSIVFLFNIKICNVGSKVFLVKLKDEKLDLII